MSKPIQRASLRRPVFPSDLRRLFRELARVAVASSFTVAAVSCTRYDLGQDPTPDPEIIENGAAGVGGASGASGVGGSAGSSGAGTSVTGFSLTADASDEFAVSTQVTGRIYASDYTAPTPADLTTAVQDMELAFTDAGSRAADVTELGAGDIGGMTLTPGVYAWGTGLLSPRT